MVSPMNVPKDILKASVLSVASFIHKNIEKVKDPVNYA